MKLGTLDTIGLTAFGTNFNTVKNGTHPVVDAFNYVLDETTRRQFEDPLSLECLFSFLPTAKNKKLDQQIGVLRNCIQSVVSDRIASLKSTPEEEEHEDLLKYMLAARREEGGQGQQITDEGLADNLLTLLFGGFDTTSIALTYTLYSVANDPGVELKALQEIERVLGAEGQPTWENLSDLPYCTAIINEALRLYPPAPLTVRTLEKDLQLTEDGPIIPKNTMMYIPIWWIHRSPLNWGNDANVFRPERHLEENKLQKSAGSFRLIAFSGGQRNCPGQRFAMMEALVMFTTLIRKLEFTVLKESRNVKSVSTGVVQKPKGGELWMHVKVRGVEVA